jgi:cysteine desulfurase / selenocysteine lyase
MAHNVGAKVLVDGAQSVPHLSVDVQALEADFLVFSGHKMYGPTGIGILYGKKELLEVMPPYQGGGDMIDKVTLEKTTYNALPLKFEAGTPMIAEVIGLGAAIDYVQKIGLERIANWEQELTDYAMEKMQTIQALKFIGHPAQRGAIITFVIEGIHPLDLGTMLNLRGIALRTGHHCSQPAMKRFGVTEAARISFAFYNTKEEIDYFIKSLKDVMKLFL